VDLDGKLDAARLPAALRRRVAAARRSAGAAPPSFPSDPVYRDSLARFRLLRVRSTAQLVRLAAALDGLVAPSTPLPAPTRLLCLDNVGAFQASERAARPPPLREESFGAQAQPRPAVLDGHTVAGALAAAVRLVARRRRLLVLATKGALGPPAPPPALPAGAPRGSVQGPVFREYMAKPWLDAVTHRLVLYRPDPGAGRVAAHWAAPTQAPAGDLLAGNVEED